MGAKGSKETPPNQKQQPRVVHISADQLINPADPTIFPEAVRNELMAVKQEIPPSELFMIKEFGPSSELVHWLHQCRSFFAYEGENNKSNYESNNEDTKAARERNRKALDNLRAALRASVSQQKSKMPKQLLPWETNIGNQKGGAGVDRDKDPFLYKLNSMCNTPNIELKFLANLLEVADRFLFAFLNTGHIAGFMIFDNDKYNKNCLHRYITCTGPRKLGIGKGLVDEVHAIAKREGKTCVTLGASDSVGFHEKMGYVPTGKRNLEGPEMIFQLQGGKTRKSKKRTTRKARK